jgi:hypothetical protein
MAVDVIEEDATDHPAEEEEEEEEEETEGISPVVPYDRTSVLALSELCVVNCSGIRISNYSYCC